MLKSTSPDIVNIPAKQFARIVKTVSVKKRTRRGKVKPVKAVNEMPISVDDGLPLMVRAQKILGDRMEERWAGYFLDGRPASYEVIAKAAGL